ncbi:MAG: hypothetical protein Q8L60_10745 [Gammaproteobacteria bacterium]|nr:hypothetical protein [Gammaproteobacteria bacterium]MDP2346825.1 hypothetical protein [Gammaproteobacteria bacterium]
MSDELKPLWDRSDEQRKALSDLQIRQAVHQEMLQTHAAQIAQISKDSSERHGELKTMISSQDKKLDTIIKEHNQELGASTYKRWLIPVLVALLGIAVTLGYVK